VRRNAIIRHRDSGGGGPPRRGGGGGAGLNAARKLPSCADIKLARFLSSKRSSAAIIRLHRKRSSASRVPSTTVRSLRELQWSPSPASRGRMVRAMSFSRCIRIRALATNGTKCSPPKNKGRQSAERRKSWAASSDAARAERSALAFRRSTAAIASTICRSSIQAALHAMECEGVTFALAPRLSEAPRAPVVMPAGSMPGPPESGSDEPPPAGTAPAPSVGVTG
jgi:hypothetical protein